MPSERRKSDGRRPRVARTMAEMQPRSGLARLGACGLVLAAAALIGGALVPGDVGALLRGYGAMLVPAVAWLYAGLVLRAVLPHRQHETSPAKVSISARDGSLRV